MKEALRGDRITGRVLADTFARMPSQFVLIDTTVDAVALAHPDVMKHRSLIH